MSLRYKSGFQSRNAAQIAFLHPEQRLDISHRPDVGGRDGTGGDRAQVRLIAAAPNVIVSNRLLL